MSINVIIPYKTQIEIDEANPLFEKLHLENNINFINYEISTPESFKQYLQIEPVHCIWITEDFFTYLEGINPYWDYLPSCLRAIVVPWVGCDFVDIKRLREEKDITICNIGPNANDNVSDLCMYLVISTFRMCSFWEFCIKFMEMGNIMGTREYIGSSVSETQDMQVVSQNGSTELRTSYKIPIKKDHTKKINVVNSFTVGGKSVDSPTGKIALILGFGSIGQTIGNKLKLAFNMEIQYHRRSGPVSSKLLGYEAKYHESLEDPETWQEADIIILALPGGDTTANIINDKTIKMCKDGVRIVNVGRGTCIDEDALLRHLDSNKIASCGLDVFKSEETTIKKEFLQRWDVTVLPHIGSAVSDIMKRSTEITLQNIESLFVYGYDGIYPLN
ncbi:hypothetical protein KAFR_0H02750 [Kazachstania africana CBS 2517]|uniref:D-isomer specific 2-hydroxyacid dehydrogenase NAD-binding domain-containing protein n=1 Tax=Kazachstania africana (strain ATCC 22294 / BCRC 22015 / CBS 2517 / CECT 1963 / NBRC 1671 / NRRL Y-8276) TaxID=1071382 RepID=H2AZC8_KAZAF|nr:hypothetical protein KAFR_0H02750 [Kazachstania africana CBS 2517]CCF59684.1 hypothetical protein KAFR_0H02750 [Kazachstania africana CBS 2517]